MKSISTQTKIVQILLFLGIIFAIFLVPQKTFAACQLLNGKFRNADNALNFPPNWFNQSVTDNNNAQPYIYLDLEFNNDCVGETISFEIQEGTPSIAMVDISFSITSESLRQTSIFKAGGDDCIVNCEYNFWIEIDGNGIENGDDGYGNNWPQTFGYECSGICDDLAWSYLGTVYSTTQGYQYQNYIAPNDPDFISASAANNSGGGVSVNNAGGVSTNNAGGLSVVNNTPPQTIQCDNGDDAGCIENPLGDGSTLPAFVQSILGIIVRAGIPLVVLAFVYTGFRFVLARGNPDKITEAKNLLLWTVIGSAVVLGAWTIATILTNTINLIIS